jgi:hypothetical protein
MRRCVNAYPSSSRKPNKESQLRENHSTDRARAEALFNKEKQMRKGAKAMAECEVAQQVTREKTARLRALRLARDAAKQSRI